MKNVNEIVASAVGTSTSAVGTAIQPNQILQTISLVITIIGGIITTVSALYMWWKNAKKDGKITKDEIDEGIDIIQNGVENIKEAIDDNKKKGDKNAYTTRRTLVFRRARHKAE